MTDNGYEVIVRVSDGTANVDLTLYGQWSNRRGRKARQTRDTHGYDATSGSPTSLDVTRVKDLSVERRSGYYRLQGGVPGGEQRQLDAITRTAVRCTTAAIGGLTASTSYQVRVRALNGETDSELVRTRLGQRPATPVVPAVEMPTLAQRHPLVGNADRRTGEARRAVVRRHYCGARCRRARCTTAYGELSDNDFTLDSTTNVVESLKVGNGRRHETSYLTLDPGLSRSRSR